MNTSVNVSFTKIYSSTLYLRTDCLARGLGTVMRTGLCLGLAGRELHEDASCDWRVLSANKTRNMLQLPGQGWPTPRLISDSYDDEICDVDISYYLYSDDKYGIIQYSSTLPGLQRYWLGLLAPGGDIHYAAKLRKYHQSSVLSGSLTAPDL